MSHNEKKNVWELTQDATDKVKKKFETKEEATRGGVLDKAVGKEGGSVKIQKLNGRIQEERTHPSSADPKESEG